jgi:multiple antibiotic resistance protein
MDLLSATILLLIVMDPLGNVPLAITLMQKVRRKRFYILRESLLAFLVLSFFLFFGPKVLEVLNLSSEALLLAGGIILFLIAIKLIFPTDSSWLGMKEGEEPLLFPLAVPLIAGPSAVATVMLLSARQPESISIWFLAIIIASVVSMAVLLFSTALYNFMGNRGLAAAQRLMGMLLTAIAVEMIIDGIRTAF